MRQEWNWTLTAAVAAFVIYTAVTIAHYAAHLYTAIAIGLPH